MDVKGWVARFIALLENSTYRHTYRHASILGSDLKRVLDDIGRHPAKEGMKPFKIGCLGGNQMRGRQRGTLIDGKVGTVCTVNDVIHT
jgi:hypothetical protein